MSMKSLSAWMEEKNIARDQLVEAAGLEERVFEAIFQGRYVPSPQQRQRLAAALGIDHSEISWGSLEVHHMYGHGPQFGRSP